MDLVPPLRSAAQAGRHATGSVEPPDLHTDGFYVFRLAADGTAAFPYVSPSCAEIYGLTSKEAEADVRLMHDAIHPEDRESFARVGDESADRLSDLVWQGRILRIDGRERLVTITSRPRRLADGSTEWQGIVADRAPGTDTDAAEAQGGIDPHDILGMLGHDIGQPLSVIAGYTDWGLEVLTRSQTGQASTNADLILQRCFEVISKQTRRLDRLRNDLLVTATADAHTIRAQPDRVNLHAHLVAAAEMRMRDVRVEVECPADLVCFVQAGHLDQILANLVSNAERFARTRIRLRAVAYDNDRARIMVEDDGPGIPPEVLDRLFTRFSHEGQARPTKAGSGLGLYIVHALAQANNGSVVYEPEREWTRFTVSLPRQPQPPAEQ